MLLNVTLANLTNLANISNITLYKFYKLIISTIFSKKVLKENMFKVTLTSAVIETNFM